MMCDSLYMKFQNRQNYLMMKKNQEAGQVSTGKDQERTFSSNGQCPIS